MTTEKARLKMAENMNSDLLHLVKSIALLESKYRKRIFKLMSEMDRDLKQLNDRIDAVIGGQ
jgi:hypothetical protein